MCDILTSNSEELVDQEVTDNMTGPCVSLGGQ